MTVTLFAGSPSGAAGIANGFGTSAFFGRPAGIAVSSSGKGIFVTDIDGHRVRKIKTSTREVIFLAGGGGQTDGMGTNVAFAFVNGIDVSNDRAYALVVDAGPGQIKFVDLKHPAPTRAPTTEA